MLNSQNTHVDCPVTCSSTKTEVTSISEHPSRVTTPKPLLGPYHYPPTMALVHAEASPSSSSDHLKVVQVADADVSSLSLATETPLAENFEGRILTYFGGRENIDIFWRKRQSKKKDEEMKSKGNEESTCNTKEMQRR